MPPRLPKQPTRVMDRYRQRLNEEMKANGETDRSLAKKMEDAGFPVPFSSINKTRSGTRQPSLDECATVAWIFGFASVEDFLNGPKWLEIQRAADRIPAEMLHWGTETRQALHEAVYDFSRAMSDPQAVAAADASNPAWREEMRVGMTNDLRWAMRDVLALWKETTDRLEEAFNGIPEVDPAAVEAMRAEMLTQGGQG